MAKPELAGKPAALNSHAGVRCISAMHICMPKRLDRLMAFRMQALHDEISVCLQIAAPQVLVRCAFNMCL